MTQDLAPLLHTGRVEIEPEHDVVERGPSRFDDVLRRLAGPVESVKAIPNSGTWAGVVLLAIGALLLVVAWVRTAALTNVGLQVPYVVSAGFTGIALVVAGLTLINLAAKRADARERSRQLGELRDVLAQLRTAVEKDR